MGVRLALPLSNVSKGDSVEHAECDLSGASHPFIALQELSQSGEGKASRFSSRGELKTLRRLVSKYNDDVEAMARDRKLNVDQHSAGELRRAIHKAGGFSALQCDGKGG